MFSHVHIRGRLAAALVVGVAASGPVATPAARAAEVTAPMLTSFSVTSPTDVVPGDAVTLAYAATDATPSLGLTAVLTDAAGHRTDLDLGRDLPSSGVASAPVPEGLANTSYRLLLLVVTDGAGGETSYSPRSVTCVPTCGAGAALPYDVTLSVTGSTPDDDVPVVTGLSVAQPSVAVGQVARLHLDDEHTVPSLARRAAMSERTFARRFAAELGTSPHQWLTGQRVLRARHLLETTDLDVERIAGACGFGTAAILRHHFQRRLGVSPMSYRRSFTREPAAG